MKNLASWGIVLGFVVVFGVLIAEGLSKFQEKKRESQLREKLRQVTRDL